jgi:hypothetical protein
MFIMLDRGDYWQCAFVIPKGSADELMKTDIDAFRGMILGALLKTLKCEPCHMESNVIQRSRAIS